MIKRDDLAKQFELVVKQEIKNHNDSILSTNISINEIREDIEEISKTFNFKINSIINQIEKEKHSLSSQSVQLSQCLSKVDNFLESEIHIRERNNREIINIHSDLKNIFSHSKQNEKNIDALRFSVSSLKDNLNTLSKDMFSFLEKNRAYTDKQIEKLKKEQVDKPCPTENLRKEFEEKLSANAIDSVGILKEINVIKKSLMIKEKYIEHLMTEIEKLKGKK